MTVPHLRPYRPVAALRLAATGAVACTALAGCAPAEAPIPGLGTTRGTATAEALDLSGDVSTHDPALVVGQDGEPWYVFSTGDPSVGDGAVQVRSSPDGRRWAYVGEAWDAAGRPSWVDDVVPGVTNYWAPEIVENDGTYYLYYSASTFGSNRSVIGLYTATTLDPDDPDHGWTDRGEVIRSEPGDNWNAIDAGIVEDADGMPWMTFGSHWGGLQIVQLEWPSGLMADADAEPRTIASRLAPPNAIEAPYVVERDGWYYLFVSKDACCRGAASTYNIQVGRSRDVTGPYVDAEGRALLADGGTPVLATDGAMVGPGGQSLSDGYLAFHYYDADQGGAFELGIRDLAWEDGWPVALTAEELEQRQGLRDGAARGE